MLDEPNFTRLDFLIMQSSQQMSIRLNTYPFPLMEGVPRGRFSFLVASAGLHVWTKMVLDRFVIA